MSGVVCPVCYEDVKPGSEDLQAVSGCGHVFHELCLQQWLEYCHRKPSCPVCKRICSKNDVHRLYFLSSGELEEKTQSNSCSQAPKVYHDVELQARVQKLEAQLLVASQGLQSSKQQLQELDTQLDDHRTRVEKAESVRRQAVTERDHYRSAFRKSQEELNACVAERSKLLEKNSSLAKELAAMKLAADYGIDENDILRYAAVGQGENKDDVIGTLIGSLVVRNTGYRDLLAKYNTLGKSERAALQKAEKASELLKRTKLRVQELEKALENQENKELRALRQRTEQADLTRCEKARTSRAHLPQQTPSDQPKDSVEPTSKPGSLAEAVEPKCSFSGPKATASSPLQIPIRRELPQTSSASVVTPAVQGDSESRKRAYATTLSLQAGARGFPQIKSSSEKGSFILTGADGRGGKVTVLKPGLQRFGLQTSSFPAPRQVKRCKQTSAKGNKRNDSGALSIDHFFDKAE